MPAYELFLMIRNMPRPELVTSIKRSADIILGKKGIIRSFEYLGNKNTAYRMKAKGSFHTTANHMLIKFDMPRDQVDSVVNEVSKEDDYIRTGIFPLIEYDENYETPCKCKEKGEFIKNAFDFQKPMTTWHKKIHYKNYGRRL